MSEREVEPDFGCSVEFPAYVLTNKLNTRLGPTSKLGSKIGVEMTRWHIEFRQSPRLIARI